MKKKSPTYIRADTLAGCGDTVPRCCGIQEKKSSHLALFLLSLGIISCHFLEVLLKGPDILIGN